MKEWLLTISVTIIISITVLLLLPEGKLYGLIKSIFSILALLSIINPLINFTDIIYATNEFIFDDKEQLLEENYLDYIYQEKINKLKSNSKKIIEEYYSNQIDIDIQFYRDNQYCLVIEKIIINISNSRINNQINHDQAKKEIEDKLSSYLSIEKDKIIFKEKDE